MIRPLYDDCTFGPISLPSGSPGAGILPESPGGGPGPSHEGETERALRRLTEEIIRHSPELAALLVAAAAKSSPAAIGSAPHPF